MSIPQDLAINGGPAIFPEGPPVWPLPDPDVLAALEAAYADGSWGRYVGPHVERLAAMLATMHHLPFALPCSSGTFAVELALRGLRVGDRDEVILAGYDFSGNFRCIEAVGATPVLADINPRTWSIDAECIRDALSAKTRAVIVSHLHGGLADMQQIMAIADDHNLFVVEDACQSPGAQINGGIAGSWGHVGVLSFGGSKLLTAGRGGALVTAKEEVFQRAKIYCERGNHAFPMSELQAAVLRPQLEKLESRNKVRASNAQHLLRRCTAAVALHPVVVASAPSRPSYYKLAWLFRSDECGGWSRERFIAAINAEGVAIDAGFRGFLRRSTRRCRKAGELEHSRRAAEATLILHHPILLQSEEVMNRVAVAITKVISTAVA